MSGVETIHCGDLEHQITMTGNDEWAKLAVTMNDLATKLHQTASSKKYVLDVISTITEPLFVTDRNLQIRSANRGTCRLFGYSKNELSGQSVLLLFLVYI